MYHKKSYFTEFETKLLYSLLNKYKTIIECKKTSSHINSKKDEAWKNIAEEFNAVKGTYKRNALQLRNKYKNMKKMTKKKITEMKVELFPLDVESAKLETASEEEMATIDVIVQSSSSTFDCDIECENAVKIIHVESVPAETAKIAFDGDFVAEDVEMLAEIPRISASTPISSEERKPLKKVTSRPKALVNTSNGLQEDTLAHKDAALAEKALKEKEIEYKEEEIEWRKKEVEWKEKEIEWKEIEHRLKMKVLEAKLKYYEEKTKRMSMLDE